MYPNKSSKANDGNCFLNKWRKALTGENSYSSNSQGSRHILRDSTSQINHPSPNANTCNRSFISPVSLRSLFKQSDDNELFLPKSGEAVPEISPDKNFPDIEHNIQARTNPSKQALPVNTRIDQKGSPDIGKIHTSMINSSTTGPELFAVTPVHATQAVLNSTPASDQSPEMLNVPALSNSMHSVSPIPTPKSISIVNVSSGSICRICYEGGEVERFISPCECSGTVARVHRTCLQKWISSTKSQRCELCGAAFPVRVDAKSFRKFICQSGGSVDRAAFLADIICFTFLTPLILVTIYFCIYGAVFYYYPQEKPPVRWTTSAKNGAGNAINTIFYPDGKERPVPSQSEILGLIILAVVLFAVFFAWIVLSIKYHRSSWKIWQRSNNEVRLETIV